MSFWTHKNSFHSSSPYERNKRYTSSFLEQDKQLNVLLQSFPPWWLWFCVWIVQGDASTSRLANLLEHNVTPSLIMYPDFLQHTKARRTEEKQTWRQWCTPRSSCGSINEKRHHAQPGLGTLLSSYSFGMFAIFISPKLWLYNFSCINYSCPIPTNHNLYLCF